MTRRSDLSGAWSGAYRYPGDAWPETVFNAVLQDSGGVFTGSTQEPDWRKIGGGVITATIDGVREGRAVSFTKHMDGSGGLRHFILYEGAANAQLTRIEGKWTIPGQWSGSFFMTRDDADAEEARAERAEAKA